MAILKDVHIPIVHRGILEHIQEKRSKARKAELSERIKRIKSLKGVHVQKLKINYNCVGSIEIPNALPLPEPEVLIQTRKGVAVSYSEYQKVVNL